MCGIVGYIGKRDAYPILTKGLNKLKYGGYDSSGGALNQQFKFKAKDKISLSDEFVFQKNISCNIGIAHSHWATYGNPYQAIAYFYYSSSENFASIHKDIIENYTVHKAKPLATKSEFRNCNDAKALAQLMNTCNLSNLITLQKNFCNIWNH